MGMEKKIAGGHGGHTPSGGKGGAFGGFVYHAAAVTGCQTRNSALDLPGSMCLVLHPGSVGLNLPAQGRNLGPVRTIGAGSWGEILQCAGASKPPLVSVHWDTAGPQHCRLDRQVMCWGIVRLFFATQDFGQVTEVAIVSAT